MMLSYCLGSYSRALYVQADIKKATRRWPMSSCCNELSCQRHLHRVPVLVQRIET